VLSKGAVQVLPKIQLRCLPREHWSTGLVPSKEALKALPKIAVAVPPKRVLVLPKGALTVLSMQSGAVKGNTQNASQDKSCDASQESTGLKEISPMGETQAGRDRGAS